MSRRCHVGCLNRLRAGVQPWRVPNSITGASTSEREQDDEGTRVDSDVVGFYHDIIDDDDDELETTPTRTYLRQVSSGPTTAA